MKYEIDPSIVPPVYQDLLLDETRYIVLYGGRGSAKTSFALRKYALRCFKNEYFKCVYVRKAQAHIRDSLYAGLKSAIDDLGLIEYFKFYDSDYRIICCNGNSFIPKGVDDPELTKGVEEVSHLLIEEITELTQEEFTTLNALLRTNKTRLQTMAMFNPIHDTHWIRAYFFDPDDSHKPNPNFGDRLKILRTTYQDNNFIDRAEYLQTLLDNAAGNINSIRVNIEGDWGLPENGNPWLYNFKQEHIREIPYLPTYPIYLSFDFNKSPVTCSVTQMSPQKGLQSSFLHVIDEFYGEMNLQQLCQNIKSKYPNSIMFVTGDASGNSGHLALEELGTKNMTFYTLIKRYLGLSERQLHINTKNLSFHDSRILCNTMLYSYPNFYIHPKCRMLIEDCTKATVDDKGQDPNKLKKDRDGYKMDMFDNFRYMLQCYFHDYVQGVLRVSSSGAK